jgi:hypothetical protein
LIKVSISSFLIENMRKRTQKKRLGKLRQEKIMDSLS